MADLYLDADYGNFIRHLGICYMLEDPDFVTPPDFAGPPDEVGFTDCDDCESTPITTTTLGPTTSTTPAPLSIVGPVNGDGTMLIKLEWTSTAVASVSIASPSQITTSAVHNYETGDSITISGTDTTPSINGTHIVTKIDANNFTIPVNVTAVVSGVGATEFATVPFVGGSWTNGETKKVYSQAGGYVYETSYYPSITSYSGSAERWVRVVSGDTFRVGGFEKQLGTFAGKISDGNLIVKGLHGANLYMDNYTNGSYGFAGTPTSDNIASKALAAAGIVRGFPCGAPQKSSSFVTTHDITITWSPQGW
jgi:hypothetical protein